MQTEYALLIQGVEPAAQIANKVYSDGQQCLLPVVQIRNITAPTRKKDHFVVKLDVIIPGENAPTQSDIRWLWPGSPGCALEDIQVLFVFKDGTLKVVEQQPEVSP